MCAFHDVSSCHDVRSCVCRLLSLTLNSLRTFESRAHYVDHALILCVVINHQKGGDCKHLGPMLYVLVINDNSLCNLTTLVKHAGTLQVQKEAPQKLKV